MALDYPLNFQDKNIIEQTKFAELKALKFKGGLPVFSAVPTYVGSEGEMVLYYTGSTYILYTYLNNGWQNIGGGATVSLNQLSGNLDLNGFSLYFPSTTAIADCLDEDDMASNSAVSLATQQSIKTYVDNSKFLLSSYSVGDVSLKGDTTQDSHQGTSMTKVAEVQIARGGALRIKFDININLSGQDPGPTVYGQIYRNGSPVGTSQLTQSETPITFSEDISGWSADDLVQLYSMVDEAGYDVVTENFQVYVNELLYFPVIAAGAIDVCNASTERTSGETSYTKIKELSVTEAGTYRISFDIKNGATGVVYGRIYKNGVAFGTEQTTDSSTYTTKSEDLAFVEGDTIELWVYKLADPPATSVVVRNFKVSIESIRGINLVTD